MVMSSTRPESLYSEGSDPAGARLFFSCSSKLFSLEGLNNVTAAICKKEQSAK